MTTKHREMSFTVTRASHYLDVRPAKDVLERGDLAGLVGHADLGGYVSGGVIAASRCTAWWARVREPRTLLPSMMSTAGSAAVVMRVRAAGSRRCATRERHGGRHRACG